MASSFLSTANSFISTNLPSSSSPSSSLAPSLSICTQKNNAKKQIILCKALSDKSPSSPNLTKRNLSICFITGFVFSLTSRGNAAILEADEDDELMEKVKRDRLRRIERQGVINSSNKEKAYLQDVVYKLSKVGQAIENNDLSAANSVLEGKIDTDWVQKANLALSKLSNSPEEKDQVDTFNSSLASLISSVVKNDIESSKTAFVSSATAFENWTTLTGLVGQLKGL
ncbi:thylakoid lumenal 16.5 kDa protein, chloroplastic [Mercurialis annua]|uniref:thylakoid lumenal 16.5 kDa protein, chloroplastic n=1 Tax=Mercurialis annua TaxID=3986 RepID=UPI002160278D|nr:thylakoid lumenal 16.5 kDa protein, chloroplastic [Mercurialis annua]